MTTEFDLYSDIEYPSPAVTAKARSDSRLMARVQVTMTRDQLAADWRDSDDSEQYLALYDAIVRLGAVQGQVTMADLMTLPLPGSRDMNRRLAWIDFNSSFMGFIMISPSWSQNDWDDEHDYRAGLYPVSDQDLLMHRKAHHHARELLCYANGNQPGGRARASAIFQMEVTPRTEGDPVVGRPGVAAGATWPSTQHLRLHYLAELQGGWKCRDCGVGLVDVCSDTDMVMDKVGRRYVGQASGKRLPTIDHGVPQSLRGSNVPANLALVCRPCNSSKGAA